MQVSGTGIFPEVELSWATFNQVQRLIQKTAGKTCVLRPYMSPALSILPWLQFAHLRYRLPLSSVG